jgi:hypothetical protein
LFTFWTVYSTIPQLLDALAIKFFLWPDEDYGSEIVSIHEIANLAAARSLMLQLYGYCDRNFLV